MSRAQTVSLGYYELFVRLQWLMVDKPNFWFKKNLFPWRISCCLAFSPRACDLSFQEIIWLQEVKQDIGLEIIDFYKFPRKLKTFSRACNRARKEKNLILWLFPVRNNCINYFLQRITLERYSGWLFPHEPESYAHRKFDSHRK